MFDMPNFMTPRNMGLMGLAAGLLQSSGASPREITLGEGFGNGLQGGMQGMQQGMALQMQQQHVDALKSQAESARQKLQQEMAMKELYRDTVQNAGTSDPVAIGRMLMGSGDMGLARVGMDMMKSKNVKQFLKGTDDKGNPTFYAGYNTGELSPTGVTPAEKLMQINQGSQIGLANPYTGQIQSAVGVGMAPGESARLAQSQAQHGDNMGMQQARMMLDARQQVQPKFVDGNWVLPPTMDNPQGTIIPTDLSVMPKGSKAALEQGATKVNSLLDEAENLIGNATGSVTGNLLDMGAGAIGVSTKGAQNIAALKTLEAGLVMGMPRLEGPQSNLDQQLYREAAGQIGNPNVPEGTKRAAIKTIRRIQNTYAGKQNNTQTQGAGASGTFSDGWGELK